jgi:hypothetical protein
MAKGESANKQVSLLAGTKFGDGPHLLLNPSRLRGERRRPHGLVQLLDVVHEVQVVGSPEDEHPLGGSSPVEQLDHSELSLRRRWHGSGRIELAAFHDGIKNAAVWGSAHPPAANWLAGNYLVNPAVGGIVVNMGDYRSTGYRAAYEQRLGNHFEALVAYAQPRPGMNVLDLASGTGEPAISLASREREYPLTR